jgi:hypothetical protein
MIRHTCECGKVLFGGEKCQACVDKAARRHDGSCTCKKCFDMRRGRNSAVKKKHPVEGRLSPLNLSAIPAEFRKYVSVIFERAHD